MRYDYYKTDYPDFYEKLDYLETTDPAHADLFNEIHRKIFENTLHLRKQMDTVTNEQGIEDAFYAVFTKVSPSGGGSGEDDTAMTAAQIFSAINTKWDGTSSSDPTAMSADDVIEAVNTQWDGTSSSDPTALSATDIEQATVAK